MAEVLKIINVSELALAKPDNAVPVVGADALGTNVATNGKLGADILWVPSNASFPIHTHPGDHLLMCLDGEGTISFDGQKIEVRPGDMYMIPGMIPHAVGAGPAGHVLLAIGSPHKPVDAPDRMKPTDWQGNAVEAPVFDDSEAKKQVE